MKGESFVLLLETSSNFKWEGGVERILKGQYGNIKIWSKLVDKIIILLAKKLFFFSRQHLNKMYTMLSVNLKINK